MDFVTPDPQFGRGTGDRVASAQRMERHAEWIGQCMGRPELAPLDRDDFTEVAALLREEHYPAGETIFRMGTPRRGWASCAPVPSPSPGISTADGSFSMSCVLVTPWATSE